jgi:CHAT domain-containing protein/tetratricopeptide (TPR) repeat protein
MSRNFASHDALLAAAEAAEAAWRRGAWGEALDAYNEILRGRLEDLRDEGPAAQAMRALDLVVIERLADLAVLFGHVRAADRLLEGYVALTAEVGNLMAADYGALKRVRLAMATGRPEDVVARLEDMGASVGDIHDIEFEAQALKTWEAGRRWRAFDRAGQAVLYTRLYLELGRLLASVGQYRDALSALARGLHHAGPRAPDLARRAALPLELAAAAALLERGDLEGARARLDALAARPELPRQPDCSLRAAELSGKLALLTGELGEARRLYSENLRECLVRGFRRAALQASMNLAHVSIFLNQTAEALRLLEQAAGVATELDDPASGARAAYLAQLARARGTSLVEGVAIAPPVARIWAPRRPQDPSTRHAEDQPHTGPSDPPPSSNYLAFFEDKAVEFQARLAAEGPGPAAACLDEMHETFAATDSELIRLRLGALRGLSHYYLGRYDEASRVLEDVAAGLSRLGLRPELWQILRVLGWCRIRLDRPRPEIEGLAEQTQRLMDSMVRTLPAEDRPILLLTKWTSEEEFLATHIDMLVREHERVERSFWLFRPWRRWALWRRLDELLRFLDRYQNVSHRRVLDVGGKLDSEPPRLWRRLLLHPPRRAVLSFLVLPDRVFLACSRWGRLDFGVSPVTRLEVREKVRRWHEAVHGPDPTASEAMSVAEALAGALQLPALLNRLPRHVRALTVVPDDSLYGFPFAAVTHGGAYLVERFALSIGFARGPTTRPARHPGAAGRRGAPADGLLVGVSRGSGAIAPLPGVTPELQEVGRWLTSRRVAARRVEDDRADKATVLAALGRCAFAHLACHGVFEVDRPDASGLVLIPERGHVEVLCIRDIARADLSGLRQVTLSACWSADNFVLPGRRVISLPETFCRAGAHSVLGCLWPVHDRTAAALMRRFYENLGKHPRDEALRRAQLDFLKSQLTADPDSSTETSQVGSTPNAERHLVQPQKRAAFETTHPVAWAGFTLSGDPGRLQF